MRAQSQIHFPQWNLPLPPQANALTHYELSDNDTALFTVTFCSSVVLLVPALVMHAVMRSSIARVLPLVYIVILPLLL